MPNPMKPVDNTSPAASRASYTTGPIAGDIEPLPTWDPSLVPRDAKLARIAPENVDGRGRDGAYDAHSASYGTLDGSHPDHDERGTVAAWPSDKLHQSGEGDDAVGPTRFARGGGSRRK